MSEEVTWVVTVDRVEYVKRANLEGYRVYVQRSPGQHDPDEWEILVEKDPTELWKRRILNMVDSALPECLEECSLQEHTHGLQWSVRGVPAIKGRFRNFHLREVEVVQKAQEPTARDLALKELDEIAERLQELRALLEGMS